MKKMFVIISLFFLFLNTLSVSAQESTILGKALNIKYEELTIGSEKPQIKQTIDVKILNGADKGEIRKIENILGSNPYYDINVSTHDKLILFTDTDNNTPEYFIADIYRLGVLIFLVAIFCILVLIIGKKKGVFSLISIGATVALIFYMLCPMILAGVNPLFATILVSLLSTLITMYLVGGVNKKSASATLGTIGALIIAGIAAALTIKFARLTGFADETTLYLYSTHPELDFTSITASIIILAALGAVMDIAMSIASTINEIHETNKNLSVKELFTAGMNVGRDVIGTMANTLILVYLGGAIPLLLLAENLDAFKFFNLNTVVTEVSSAIIGSIALLLCVPITAIITANLIKFNDKKLRSRDIIISNEFIKEENND